MRLRKFFEMGTFPKKVFFLSSIRKTTILILSVVFFFASSAADVFAQRKFSKSYPAGKNVKLVLTNRAGTVVVEGWNKPEVKIMATMESPAAVIVPQLSGAAVLIDVVKDNQDKNVGDVNFIVKVPYSSSVNIQTRMGNLNVTNISGGLVRARISTEGDITLTNIAADFVAAENIRGEIFFDGKIQPNGTYRFDSMSGGISLRVPFDSSFSFVATAPTTRNISLGPFSNEGLKFVSDGRRVMGQINGGNATLTMTTQRGNIAFIRR